MRKPGLSFSLAQRPQSIPPLLVADSSMPFLLVLQREGSIYICVLHSSLDSIDHVQRTAALCYTVQLSQHLGDAQAKMGPGEGELLAELILSLYVKAARRSPFYEVAIYTMSSVHGHLTVSYC